MLKNLAPVWPLILLFVFGLAAPLCAGYHLIRFGLRSLLHPSAPESWPFIQNLGLSE
jgi:hypothetical protein